VRKTAGRQGTVNAVIKSLEELFSKHQDGTADLTMATEFLRRSIGHCGSEDERHEVLAWMQGVLLSEPLCPASWQVDRRPASLYPLIIRAWAEYGDTETLCRFIMGSDKFSDPDFSSRWARWKCFELSYSISSDPLRFSRSTLNYIKQRCAEISNQTPPDSPEFPRSFSNEQIAKLTDTVSHAEFVHLKNSLSSQETQPVQEQLESTVKTQMDYGSWVTLRRATVRRLMAGKADFKDPKKLRVLIAALDKQKILLPRRANGHPRHGTYASAKRNATWPKICKTLIRDVNPRYKSI
jgi:hypothetical protein